MKFKRIVKRITVLVSHVNTFLLILSAMGMISLTNSHVMNLDWIVICPIMSDDHEGTMNLIFKFVVHINNLTKAWEV